MKKSELKQSILYNIYGMEIMRDGHILLLDHHEKYVNEHLPSFYKIATKRYMEDILEHRSYWAGWTKDRLETALALHYYIK